MNHPFVRTWIHRDVLDSTSDHAKARLLAGSPPLPMLVRADRQDRGRGRGDHAWWSDAGSLTVTLALDPASHGLRPDHEPRLALATAVAAIDAIESLAPGAPLGIRWPNDVEAGDRKLGGILPERLETPDGPRLLIGIGLNVSTDLAHAPPEVRRMATTVEALRGSQASSDDVLVAMLDRFAAVLPGLAGDDPSLSARWDSLDTLRGRTIRVDLGARIVRGVGRGIDERGGLRIEDSRGVETLFGGRVLRLEGPED